MKYTVIIHNTTIQSEKYWIVYLDRADVTTAAVDANDSVVQAANSDDQHLTTNDLRTVAVFEGVHLDRYQSSDSTILVV